MWLRCLSAVGAAFLAVPAVAETPEQLDQLVVATPAAGLALARQEAQAGNLLPALSIIESVLFAKPKNKEARLMHATLLCRLDDLSGAAVHIAQLKRKDYPRADWQQMMKICGAKNSD